MKHNSSFIHVNPLDQQNNSVCIPNVSSKNLKPNESKVTGVETYKNEIEKMQSQMKNLQRAKNFNNVDANLSVIMNKSIITNGD